MPETEQTSHAVPSLQAHNALQRRVDELEYMLQKAMALLSETPVETEWVSIYTAAKSLPQDARTIEKLIRRDLELKGPDAIYKLGYNVIEFDKGKYGIAKWWLGSRGVVPISGSYLKAI